MKTAAENMQKWRDTHPGWTKVPATHDAYRNRQLKRNFGIDLPTYRAMLQKQENVCDICGKPNPNGFDLAVDHDHKTGKVRALLCRTCNAGLGSFFDNPELMAKAITYLTREA